MNKFFEHTCKDNPEKLTKKQHIFPAESIKRFYNEDCYVKVKRKNNNKYFPAKAGNKIFCAKRIWDERSEKIWMKSIEDEF
jgi:hypothetical protein